MESGTRAQVIRKDMKDSSQPRGGLNVGGEEGKARSGRPAS